MPGVQRDAGAWDKFDAGTDSETDSDSDGRVVRVNMGESSDDEATPDEYRWLGDEREDLEERSQISVHDPGRRWVRGMDIAANEKRDALIQQCQPRFKQLRDDLRDPKNRCQ